MALVPYTGPSTSSKKPDSFPTTLQIPTGNGQIHINIPELLSGMAMRREQREFQMGNDFIRKDFNDSQQDWRYHLTDFQNVFHALRLGLRPKKFLPPQLQGGGFDNSGGKFVEGNEEHLYSAKGRDTVMSYADIMPSKEKGNPLGQANPAVVFRFRGNQLPWKKDPQDGGAQKAKNGSVPPSAFAFKFLGKTGLRHMVDSPIKRTGGEEDSFFDDKDWILGNDHDQISSSLLPLRDSPINRPRIEDLVDPKLEQELIEARNPKTRSEQSDSKKKGPSFEPIDELEVMFAGLNGMQETSRKYATQINHLGGADNPAIFNFLLKDDPKGLVQYLKDNL